jgi:hypothetical protein
MKTTLKVSGTIELTDDDLFSVLKDYAIKNREILTSIINSYIKEKYGYTPAKIQYPTEGLDRIAVIIDSTTDEGAKPLGTFKEPKAVNSAKGFKRTWSGLYAAIGEVIEHQKARKKKFISFEDLHAELLDMQDNKSNKLFVKNGVELPMSIVKHRTSQSQLDRQAGMQKNLKGVKVDKKNKGLSF